MPAKMLDLYPTRHTDKPEWQKRLDPVVHSDELSGSPVPHEKVEGFRQKGYMVLPGLYQEAEVAVFRAEIDRLRADPLTRSSEKTIREPGSESVRSVFAIHRDNPLFARVARDERIAGIARFLLGGDIYIHQSRLNFKPGFTGKEFYWHSDFETWHAEDGMPRMRAVSCSILLTTNNVHNGPLMLIPGSHRHFIPCVGETPENHYRESLKKQEYGVPDHKSLEELTDRYGIETVTGPPGTAVFFDSNIMHGSNSNITPMPRVNLFYVFNQTGNIPEDFLRSRSPRPDFVAERTIFEPLVIQRERFI
jgi:ectoine hydroxylase